MRKGETRLVVLARRILSSFGRMIKITFDPISHIPVTGNKTDFFTFYLNRRIVNFSVFLELYLRILISQ